MTHYDTLGISKQATAQEIKTAYRTLAKKYHPDKTQGNQLLEEKFKQINHAYDILSDPNKKANYDFIIATYSNQQTTYPPKQKTYTAPKTKTRKPYDYSHYNQEPQENYNRKDYNKLEWFALKNSNLASCLFIIAIGIILIVAVFLTIEFKNSNMSNRAYVIDSSNPTINEHIAQLNNKIIADSQSYETYTQLGDAYAGKINKYNYYPNRASIYYELAYNKLINNCKDSSLIRDYTLLLFHNNLNLESNKSKNLELSILKNIDNKVFATEEENYFNAFIAYHNAYYKYSIEYAKQYLQYNPTSAPCMVLIIHSQLHLNDYINAQLNYNELIQEAPNLLTTKEKNNFASVFEKSIHPSSIDCNQLFERYESPILATLNGLQSVYCYEKKEEEN
jgi:curved DNA-binding protein CbpA